MRKHCLRCEYEKIDEELLYLDDGHEIIGEQRKRIFNHDPPEYTLDCHPKMLELRPGLCFETPQQLHKAVQQYAIYLDLNVRL